MKAAIVISERDNVATALEPLERGRALDVAGHHLITREAIPSGHKVALIDISEGSPVVKYGSPIGTAACAITGGHARAHAQRRERSRPRRSRERPDEDVRLAEPPDDRSGRGLVPGGGHD